MTDLEHRIAEGVADLRARFADRMAQTPALSDPSPQGEGPRNRHGMPKEPPGQNVFEKHEWPVLDIGVTPAMVPDTITSGLRLTSSSESAGIRVKSPSANRPSKA